MASELTRWSGSAMERARFSALTGWPKMAQTTGRSAGTFRSRAKGSARTVTGAGPDRAAHCCRRTRSGPFAGRRGAARLHHADRGGCWPASLPALAACERSYCTSARPPPGPRQAHRPAAPADRRSAPGAAYGEGAIGRRRSGRVEPTSDCQPSAARWRRRCWSAGDQGLVERAHDQPATVVRRHRFCPAVRSRQACICRRGNLRQALPDARPPRRFP